MNPLLKVNPPRPGLNPLKGKVNPLREILSKQCNKSRIGAILTKLLELPKGHKVVTCMVIGYPSVQYRRIVPRKDLQMKTL